MFLYRKTGWHFQISDERFEEKRSLCGEEQNQPHQKTEFTNIYNNSYKFYTQKFAYNLQNMWVVH